MSMQNLAANIVQVFSIEFERGVVAISGIASKPTVLN
jgi:hypothetical protein